jgi:uncharacterized membrane protein
LVFKSIPQRPSRDFQWLIILLFTGYAIALVLLSANRAFWVDELLQLFGTRDLALRDLPRYVATFPGAAPIGYFTQNLAISAFGFSRFSARLPSELPSFLGCLGLVFLFRQLGIADRYKLAVLAWMLLPLQLRYGVEARPYALGLLFSILTTCCFFRLVSRPSYRNGVFYCLTIILGLYTAPYTLFLQVGFVVWTIVLQKDRSLRTIAVLALSVAGCAFAPWYLSAANYWKHYLAITADVGFHITPKFVLLPVQEISGGGYVCSIPLILLAVIGYRSKFLSAPVKRCLLAGILAGIVCVLAADVMSGYFFAIRQIMFILVPIIILVAAGLETLFQLKQIPVLIFLLSVLLVGAIVKDVRYFVDRSEDWGRAADGIAVAVDGGACLKLVGGDDPRFYTFYKSSLAKHLCDAQPPPGQSLALPFTRYTAAKDLRDTQLSLLQSGYIPLSTSQNGGTTLILYKKTVAK